MIGIPLHFILLGFTLQQHILLFRLLFCLPAIPDKPVGPLKVSDIKSTQLFLSWEPPMYDGGCPISLYIVSCKSGFSERRLGSTEDTHFLVTDLEEGKEYVLYVCAQNMKGNSEAIEIKVQTRVAKGKS